MPSGAAVLVVVDLLDEERALGRLPGQRDPARTLQRGARGAELPPKRIRAAEGSLDAGFELARRRRALVRLEVAPEDGMQDVARVVEREVLLELVDAGEVALPRAFRRAPRALR